MYIDFVTTVMESPCNKKFSSAALNPKAALNLERLLSEGLRYMLEGMSYSHYKTYSHYRTYSHYKTTPITGVGRWQYLPLGIVQIWTIP